MRPNKAVVFLHDKKAGILERITNGYRFEYDKDYTRLAEAEPVSLTLPITDKPYQSEKLFPFFAGLIPEGWLLELTVKTLKLDPSNTFDILLSTCKECIGAVSIVPVIESKS